MYTIHTSSKADTTMARIVVVVTVVFGVYLYFFNPLEGLFYPPCWFYELTGLYCAGCGITRSTHSFVHGEFAIALDYNILLPLLLAVFAIWVVKIGGILFWKKTIKLTYKPVWVYWVVFAIVGGFFLLRNIPHPLFQWLAP